MASSLKRKRTASPELKHKRTVCPTVLRTNPPLPALSTDNALTVFTHPSIAPPGTDIQSNERFRIIGEAAIHYAVNRLHWGRDDGQPYKTVEEDVRMYLGEENLAEWAHQYHLRERLRYGAEAAASVDKNAELANLFRAYAGAVDRELGPLALTSWIENIITTALETPLLPCASQSTTSQPTQPTNAKTSQYSVLLNESAQQKRHKLDYKSESTGPSHNLVWRTQVLGPSHFARAGMRR